MSTIYTLNGKVLKNAANDKWLIKAPPPPPSFDSVTIGSQIWMSKNLSIDDGQGGINSDTVNYGQGDVVEYYYTWEAAVRVAASVQGWHLPTQEEWNTLINTIGSFGAGTKLKSTYGWSYANGTDDYGFTVLPSGVWYSSSFQHFGTEAWFWTSTVSSSTLAYSRMFDVNPNIEEIEDDKRFGHSVRLIKDSE